ncbi:hypothetical protein MKK68_18455 [Methylobacterium sp. E-016]|uniref:hypothetical protein n=1 Tax=Methylobacterium sp. E-016 TaxID=2836556 RepID=UPI001FB883D8|nr:hypothetical protein [Methylobacterium sp. E-016]MCJ2077608.1 hypothetical protein [Methylobacterium sp. E-016]
MPGDDSGLYQRAVRLALDWKGNIFELAETLSALRADHPAQFADWLKRPDVSRRRTYYLVKIAEAYNELPIARDRLNRLGWTKLNEMAEIITEANADELIALAERSTVVELRRGLAMEQPAEKACSMVFHLDAEQHRDLSKALILNGAKPGRRGLSNKEAAITQMAQLFLASKYKINSH